MIYLDLQIFFYKLFGIFQIIFQYINKVCLMLQYQLIFKKEKLVQTLRDTTLVTEAPA